MCARTHNFVLGFSLSINEQLKYVVHISVNCYIKYLTMAKHGAVSFFIAKSEVSPFHVESTEEHV